MIFQSNKKAPSVFNTLLENKKMYGHIIVEMGFIPLVRQNALSQSQWLKFLLQTIAPQPSEAIIHEDDSDLESDAGWYPEERDVEQGLVA